MWRLASEQEGSQWELLARKKFWKDFTDQQEALAKRLQRLKDRVALVTRTQKAREDPPLPLPLSQSLSFKIKHAREIRGVSSIRCFCSAIQLKFTRCKEFATKSNAYTTDGFLAFIQTVEEVRMGVCRR